MRHYQRGIGTVIILVLFLIVGVAIASAVFVFDQKKKEDSINSFEDCAKLYPVMESYPAQCNTPDGRHFAQQLSDEEQKKLVPPIEIKDEVGEWKTYRNEQFGYEINYPGNFYVLGPYGGPASDKCMENPENASIVQFSANIPEYCGFVGEQLPNPQIDFTIVVYDQELVYDKASIYKEKYNFNGIDARKFIFTEDSELPNIADTRIAFNHNKKGYVIFLKQKDKKGNYDKIYDEMLATFKLTN